jgi:hypothetical protein
MILVQEETLHATILVARYLKIYLKKIDEKSWKNVEINGEKITQLVCGHSASIWRGSVYIFGGLTKSSNHLNDFYKLTIESFPKKKGNSAKTSAEDLLSHKWRTAHF